jgi:hypothetical protein
MLVGISGENTLGIRRGVWFLSCGSCALLLDKKKTMHRRPASMMNDDDRLLFFIVCKGGLD